MHVALYSPHWPPARSANGIVSYVSTVRDHLIGKGHEVSILSAGNFYMSDGRCLPLAPPIEELSGLSRMKRRAASWLDGWHGGLPSVGHMLAAQVRAAHRIAPIDLFEMEESFGWSETVRRLSRIPVVTRLHGPAFLRPTGARTARERRYDRQKCRIEARAVRCSSTLTAPTRAIMEATCAAYRRLPRDHDSVIPNPVRLAPESRRWSLSDCDRNHILMVGRFDYSKGADTMLLAFGKVLESHPSAHLTLVGPIIGIQYASGENASFDEFARRYLPPEAAARVKLTGMLSGEEISLLRQQAFVTVIASRSETFSYTLVEGLAAGSPMLSTAWPASNEIIKDGETGFLTPVGNPEAMAARLGWLLDHPETAAQVAARGRAHCAATFSIDTVGDGLLECYRATVRSAAA